MTFLNVTPIIILCSVLPSSVLCTTKWCSSAKSHFSLQMLSALSLDAYTQMLLLNCIPHSYMYMYMCVDASCGL